jgi:hypothetical protein
MAHLALKPDQSGYSIRDSDDYVMIEVDGGLPRTRRDLVDGTRLATLTWITDSIGYTYLKNFEIQNLANDCEPFTIDLYVDDGILETVTALLVPRTLRLASKQGDMFTVSAQLEVLASNLTAPDSASGGAGDGFYAGSTAVVGMLLLDTFQDHAGESVTAADGNPDHRVDFNASVSANSQKWLISGGSSKMVTDGLGHVIIDMTAVNQAIAVLACGGHTLATPFTFEFTTETVALDDNGTASYNEMVVTLGSSPFSIKVFIPSGGTQRILIVWNSVTTVADVTKPIGEHVIVVTITDTGGFATIDGVAVAPVTFSYPAVPNQVLISIVPQRSNATTGKISRVAILGTE